MRIEKIALHELDEFIRSDQYKQFEVKPITPMRAASYLRNPHARPGDNVLYMLLERSKLIAFRTLFADKLVGEDEPFGWLSGNWVHPDYRRHGHSEKLLEEAFSDWNGRLMFTNYAPASLELYMKSGKFDSIYSAEGTRFYLFAKPSKLLAERMPGWKFLLYLFDVVVSIVASVKTAFFNSKQLAGFETKLVEGFDDECASLLKAGADQKIFDRNKKSFRWIFSYPWVSTADKRFLKNYPFSSFSDSFRYETLKIYAGETLKGFVFYSVRDKHLRTLYHSLTPETVKIAAQHLSNLAAAEKIETATVLDPELAKAVAESKKPFIKAKNIEHRIYSSFKFEQENKKIQSGDGDFVFS